MNKLNRKRLLLIKSLLPVFMLFILVQASFALTGPINIIPDGFIFTDSDTDNGEQWGRAGGRTFSYSGINQELFSQISWGPANSQSVSIAFDGNADVPSENALPFSIDGSGKMIIWNGQTTISIFDGNDSYVNQPVQTRFVLTIINSDGLVTVNSVTGLPQIELTSLQPDLSNTVSFSVRLEMLATNPDLGDGLYYPALDVYNDIHTDPNASEMALTGFNYGFFYELAEVGMTVDEHDEHITELMGGLNTEIGNANSYLNFFLEDWNPKFEQVWINQGNIQSDTQTLINNMGMCVSEISQINLNTQNIPQSFNDLSNNMGMCASEISQINLNTQNIPQSFNDLSNQLNNLSFDSITEKLDKVAQQDAMLYLFGLEEFIEDASNFPPFDMVKNNSDLYIMLTGLENSLSSLHLNLNAKCDGLSVMVNGLTGRIDALDQNILSEFNNITSQTNELINNVSLLDISLNNQTVLLSSKLESNGQNISQLQNDFNIKINQIDEKLNALLSGIDDVQIQVNKNIPGKIEMESVTIYKGKDLFSRNKHEHKFKKGHKKHIVVLLLYMKENGQPSAGEVVSVEGLVTKMFDFEKIDLEFKTTPVSEGIVKLTILMNRFNLTDKFIINAAHTLEDEAIIHGSKLINIK